MNIRNLLWDAAKVGSKKAMPILSFPAAQKLGVSVETLVKDASLQAKAMEIVALETDTIAAVSLMDLSVEAEAFGAKVRFAEDEVPAIIGQLVSETKPTTWKYRICPPDALPFAWRLSVPPSRTSLTNPFWPV